MQTSVAPTEAYAGGTPRGNVEPARGFDLGPPVKMERTTHYDIGATHKVSDAQTPSVDAYYRTSQTCSMKASLARR
jgi:hypothetical protein